MDEFTQNLLDWSASVPEVVGTKEEIIAHEVYKASLKPVTANMPKTDTITEWLYSWIPALPNTIGFISNRKQATDIMREAYTMAKEKNYVHNV